MVPEGMSQGGTQPGGPSLPGGAFVRSWDPEGVALEALRAVVAAYGQDALDDERALSNRLADLMADTLPRERNLLLAVSRHRGVSEMRERLAQGVGLDAAVRLVADRLDRQEALDSSGTIWALGAMAQALGLNAVAPPSAPPAPPLLPPVSPRQEVPYSTEPLSETQTVSVGFPSPQVPAPAWASSPVNPALHPGGAPVRTNRKLIIGMVVLIAASGATGASLALFTGKKVYTGPPANAVPSQVFSSLRVPSDLLSQPLSESSQVMHNAPAASDLTTVQKRLPSSCSSFVYWLFGPVSGYSTYFNSSQSTQNLYDTFEETQLVASQPQESSDFGEYTSASARTCIAMAYDGSDTNQPAASVVSIPSPPSGEVAEGLEAFPTSSLRLTTVLVGAGRLEVFLQWSTSATDPAPNIGPAVTWVEDEAAQLASK